MPSETFDKAVCVVIKPRATTRSAWPAPLTLTPYRDNRHMNLIKKLRTVAELAAALATLDAEIAAADSALPALEADAHPMEQSCGASLSARFVKTWRRTAR